MGQLNTPGLSARTGLRVSQTYNAAIFKIVYNISFCSYMFLHKYDGLKIF